MTPEDVLRNWPTLTDEEAEEIAATVNEWMERTGKTAEPELLPILSEIQRSYLADILSLDDKIIKAKQMLRQRTRPRQSSYGVSLAGLTRADGVRVTRGFV